MASLLLRKRTRRNNLWFLHPTTLTQHLLPSSPESQSQSQKFPLSQKTPNPIQNHDFSDSAVSKFLLKSSKHVASSTVNVSGRRFDSQRRRFFGSQTAAEPSTSDGLTVERIVANGWTILDESENDWKSHAAAVAQSIHLIKKRMKVTNC